ncbi:MAG: YhgN family NAAT transporter [Gammaproteobacteria bacterium]|nr:YhgN family NAAT transporter [Gammaproteobacteria bacterium]
MDFISATILLFMIMDPLGNIPLYQVVLGKLPAERRRYVVIRELVFAYAILCMFLFAGETILGVLGLENSSLSIAGGVVLFLIAIRMVFPAQHGQLVDDNDNDPFIVPLAVPFVAGPSAIAALLLLGSRYPEQMWSWFAALSMAWLAAAVILVGTEPLMRVLGKRGIRAIEKLMGMLLIMVSIQMLLDGFSIYMQSNLSAAL